MIHFSVHLPTNPDAPEFWLRIQVWKSRSVSQLSPGGSIGPGPQRFLMQALHQPPVQFWDTITTHPVKQFLLMMSAKDFHAPNPVHLEHSITPIAANLTLLLDFPFCLCSYVTIFVPNDVCNTVWLPCPSVHASFANSHHLLLLLLLLAYVPMNLVSLIGPACRSCSRRLVVVL